MISYSPPKPKRVYIKCRIKDVRVLEEVENGEREIKVQVYAACAGERVMLTFPLEETPEEVFEWLQERTVRGG